MREPKITWVNSLQVGHFYGLTPATYDFYSLLVNKLDFARGDQFHWKGAA